MKIKLTEKDREEIQEKLDREAEYAKSSHEAVMKEIADEEKKAMDILKRCAVRREVIKRLMRPDSYAIRRVSK
jgi:hypothetical protein